MASAMPAQSTAAASWATGEPILLQSNNATDQDTLERVCVAYTAL